MVSISNQIKFLSIWLTFLDVLWVVNGKRNFTDKEKEMVKLVNSEDNGWIAGFNEVTFDKSVPIKESASSEVGDDALMLNVSSVTSEEFLPPKFDARKYFKSCAQDISYVRDQGKCFTGWAQAAAGVITDRICVASIGEARAIISAEDIVQCCGENCHPTRNKCDGGNGWKAFQMWRDVGVVTGGNYESRIGCKEYSEDAYLHRQTIECEDYCTTPGYIKFYSQAKFFAREHYRLPNNSRAIQEDILQNGPVMAGMQLYEDFDLYKTGVYKHITGNHYGYHFVRIVGWGVSNGRDYWLAINSLGPEWGDLGGDFKILRGADECEIEYEVRGGIPGSRNNTDGHNIREASGVCANLDHLSWHWQCSLLFSSYTISNFLFSS